MPLELGNEYVWYHIAYYLHCTDVLNLSATCRELRPLYRQARKACVRFEAFKRNFLRYIVRRLAGNGCKSVRLPQNCQKLLQEVKETPHESQFLQLFHKKRWQIIQASPTPHLNEDRALEYICQIPLGIIHGMAIVFDKQDFLAQGYVRFYMWLLNYVFEYYIHVNDEHILETENSIIIPVKYFIYNLPLHVIGGQWRMLVCASVKMQKILLFSSENCIKGNTHVMGQPAYSAYGSKAFGLQCYEFGNRIYIRGFLSYMELREILRQRLARTAEIAQSNN